MLLRIVSYNIHSGKNFFWQDKLAEMAETLKQLNADIISLQEVHQNSRYGYQAHRFADIIGYHTIFAPALPVADGAYGNALLTRLPIVDSQTRPLPAKREPRSLLQARLAWNQETIEIWNTHCSLHRQNRDQQFDTITKWMEEEHKMLTPLVLTGDFNTVTPRVPSLLCDCAAEKKQENSSTLLPFSKRIDFIFASPHWKVADYEVIGVRWSDHYPIVATLERVVP